MSKATRDGALSRRVRRTVKPRKARRTSRILESLQRVATSRQPKPWRRASEVRRVRGWAGARIRRVRGWAGARNRGERFVAPLSALISGQFCILPTIDSVLRRCASAEERTGVSDGSAVANSLMNSGDHQRRWRQGQRPALPAVVVDDQSLWMRIPGAAPSMRKSRRQPADGVARYPVARG
jgi:hypothetical protein